MTKETEKRYRLTITGDADLIRQVADALDLQGRLHLGQIGEVEKELQRGFIPDLWRAQTDAALESQRQEVYAFFRYLRIMLQAAQSAWEEMRRQLPREGGLFPSFHHNERERRAYALWKLIRNGLARAEGRKPEWDDYIGNAAGNVAVTVIDVAAAATVEERP